MRHRIVATLAVVVLAVAAPGLAARGSSKDLTPFFTSAQSETDRVQVHAEVTIGFDPTGQLEERLIYKSYRLSPETVAVMGIFPPDAQVFAFLKDSRRRSVEYLILTNEGLLLRSEFFQENGKWFYRTFQRTTSGGSLTGGLGVMLIPRTLRAGGAFIDHGQEERYSCLNNELVRLPDAVYGQPSIQQMIGPLNITTTRLWQSAVNVLKKVGMIPPGTPGPHAIPQQWKSELKKAAALQGWKHQGPGEPTVHLLTRADTWGQVTCGDEDSPPTESTSPTTCAGDTTEWFQAACLDWGSPKPYCMFVRFFSKRLGVFENAGTVVRFVVEDEDEPLLAKLPCE